MCGEASCASPSRAVGADLSPLTSWKRRPHTSFASSQLSPPLPTDPPLFQMILRKKRTHVARLYDELRLLRALHERLPGCVHATPSKAESARQAQPEVRGSLAAGRNDILSSNQGSEEKRKVEREGGQERGRMGTRERTKKDGGGKRREGGSERWKMGGREGWTEGRGTLNSSAMREKLRLLDQESCLATFFLQRD
ncbi:MAG: hypothetical protein SGPRY_014919, partial [Prymnesium sp.]